MGLFSDLVLVFRSARRLQEIEKQSDSIDRCVRESIEVVKGGWNGEAEWFFTDSCDDLKKEEK